MFLKNKFFLLGLLTHAFAIIGMEEHNDDIQKYKSARTAEEWELLYSISQNYEPKVNFLIDEGVNLNIKDRLGETALSVAIKNASPFMVKMLIQNGALVMQQDLRDSIMDGKDEVAKILIKKLDANINGNTELEPILILTIMHCNAYPRLANIIPLLIRKGADIKATYAGHTAIEYGAEFVRYGKMPSEILELLKRANESIK